MARLLIVDDTPTNMLILQRRIRKHLPDSEVVAVSSPEEALLLAEQNPPDCAIVDLYMPRFTGIDLARELKRRHLLQPFPILIVTSGDTQPSQRIQALEAGADDILDRNCTEQELVSKLRVLLRIRRAETELRLANRDLSQVAGQRSEDLYESAERFRAIFEIGSDIVLVLELKDNNELGRIIDANPAACVHLGYGKEELLVATPAALFTREMMRQWPLRLRALLEHRQTGFASVLLRRTGRAIAATMHARLIDNAGRRTVLLACQPTGEIAQAREEAGGRRYRLLASQTAQIIYEMRVADFTLKVSGAFTQLTGRPVEVLENMQGGLWEEFIHPEDRPYVLRTFREALRDLGKYHMHWRLMHADGSVRHVEDLGVVVAGEDGKAQVVLGTLRDMTVRIEADEERMRAEQREQHSRKLESLGVLAGGIAHDFNNILAAIIGLTDMALQELPQGSAIHEDMSEVLRAGHRAKDLVKQILKFSRQEQEDRRPIFLHQVVREALRLLRASLPPNIDIIDATDVLSGQVLASAAQMHQIVMNYCTNAAHAIGKEQGTIEVTLRDVEVDERIAAKHPLLHPGPYVKLTVMDSGHGMDKRILDRIFDPFFTTKPQGEGTGMGLAVVHGIVSAHGGAVLVDSKPGMGAAFHTFLPRVDARPEADTEPGRAPHRGSARIMFVDDEEAVLRFVQAALQPLGYRVSLFEDPTVALEQFQKTPDAFDLVLTDLMMPKLMGDALIEGIRAVRSDIPVLLFTGFGDFLTEERHQALKIREVVLKPIIAKDLADAVHRALISPPAPTGGVV